jgi:GNAT superfamily N-acetyltransferase
MWWRVSGREFSEGEGNKAALRRLAEQRSPTGILGYATVQGAAQPVAWAAVSPRDHLLRLARSPLSRGSEGGPGVWAVPCLYVTKRLRRQGIARATLLAACDHARLSGATCVEGYPTERPAATSSQLYVGTVDLFTRCGFTEVRRISPHRPVMRLQL